MLHQTLRRLILTCLTAALAGAAPAEYTIAVAVVDQDNRAVAGVLVQLKVGTAVIASAVTDVNGEVELPAERPGGYEISATKDGFTPIRRAGLDLSQPTTSVNLTLVPAARRESVDVRATVTPVEQGSSPPNDVAPQIARELPGRPATVADALPLVPGVVRTPGGGLQISGSGEHRSALIVNSADVTDPATGQFGLTVPIDSVETLNVYQTPFLAEFGRFTSGLVSVETRRGGEKWKWELNDPFPEFRIRSWDLRGLRTATPRLNAEGPLIPGKLYFSEGFEFAVRKTEVFTLPFPYNQKKQEGINSFAQLDWVVSDKQLVTATVHVAPQRLDFVNMNYFNPQPTTPDASTRNYTTTIGDRLTLGNGLLENTISLTAFDARVWGQGSQDLTVAPGGNSGNYFAQQSRNASRLGWGSTYHFAPVSALGTHQFKAGWYLAGSWETGQVTDHPVDIVDSTNQLLQRIAFTAGQPFHMTDMDYAFFGQDHWIVTPNLSVDLGLRTESQAVSGALRLAPRAGIAWSPFPNAGTVVRAGAGLFYDRVPLNVYAFNHYPNEVVTTYDAAGQIAVGPIVYQNALGTVGMSPPLVFEEPQAGNFSPRSETWNVQVEQPVTRYVRLRAGVLENQSSGLVILNSSELNSSELNPTAPDPPTSTALNLLSGTGRSRYRQFEITAKVHLNERGQLFFSYVRSRARGDLNDFNNYLGSTPVPIVRANQAANLPTDLPNRFLTWGALHLPWKIGINPVIEYRSGFPYAVTDAAQNYVGIPNQTRFPSFVSVDARISKDFQVNPKYSVRLSVSGFNLTDHFNPEAFHANIADPAYGLFFGQRGRHFTADFDVIF
jgi:hypothetical protein